ncbi:helix-turn-helix psq domain [Holotrichia oblita]|uniref:Helix-turn-helix psq domain n=1 Tax=Holotrichia oblita TaxID=644536 RepID=A0ACB9TS91_HOLOL|nr:helix-turn-helix psq domain [Holotrichia oblita]
MVSKYKRTTNQQEWSSENMKQALEAIKNKEMGWLKASKTFGVPATTLRRRAKSDTGCKKKLGRYAVTFPEELEEALCRRVLELESRLFGVTAKELCMMAFQLAEKLKISHRFNREKGAAGLDWLIGFRRRRSLLLRLERSPSIGLRSKIL